MSGVIDGDLFTGRITDDVMNLCVGAPGPETLKKSAELFDSAARHRLQKFGGCELALFQYGPECGSAEFLQQLAQFLTKEYSNQVSSDDLILTCGATSGLHLAASTLLNPGDETVVFVECPTYFIALDILHKDLKLRIIPIPMLHDGVDLSILESSVKNEFDKISAKPLLNKGHFWAMFYTIPTFHNPTGILTSSEKSKRVVEIARKYDLLVFCDDVYNLLYYDTDTSPERLVAYDNSEDPDYHGGRCVSNGTFSKILAPGIRVGWMESGPRIRDQIRHCGVLSSSGAMNNLMSGFISSTLELELQAAHVQHLREVYRKRIIAVKSVFETDLLAGFHCRFPSGGYFLWISGPPDFDARAFSLISKSQFGVRILPGATCSPCSADDPELDSSMTCKNAFRLSIAYYQENKLVEGAQQLCKALKKFMN